MSPRRESLFNTKSKPEAGRYRGNRLSELRPCWKASSLAIRASPRRFSLQNQSRKPEIGCNQAAKSGRVMRAVFERFSFPVVYPSISRLAESSKLKFHRKKTTLFATPDSVAVRRPKA